MKANLHLTILLLLVATCSTSFALMAVGTVSKKQAAELGIEIRAKAGGPKHAWVELEFKAEGTLGNFQHVNIVIPDGDQLGLGWTPLKDTRTTSGNVLVRVMGSRRFLETTTLQIVTGDLGDSGWNVRLKDFVDFEKLSAPSPAKGPDKPAADADR